MKMLTIAEQMKMQEAWSVHKKTGCQCKNCVFFHKVSIDILTEMEYGECENFGVINGNNYCSYFRFK